MINISNNIITMNRCDKFAVPLFINAGDKMNKLRYIVQPEDKLMLSVMYPNGCFEHGVIRKQFTSEDLNHNNDVVITLESSDTENVLPGTYYYQVILAIKRGNDFEYSTVVPKRKFILL